MRCVKCRTESAAGAPFLLHCAVKIAEESSTEEIGYETYKTTTRTTYRMERIETGFVCNGCLDRAWHLKCLGELFVWVGGAFLPAILGAGGATGEFHPGWLIGLPVAAALVIVGIVRARTRWGKSPRDGEAADDIAHEEGRRELNMQGYTDVFTRQSYALALLSNLFYGGGHLSE